MSNSEIDKKVKATLDSMQSIDEVKVSPFLKDRILHQIDAFEDRQESSWLWFTPSLQLATLIVFMVLNVYAYININSEAYNSSIDEFTETYGLGEETDTFIF